QAALAGLAGRRDVRRTVFPGHGPVLHGQPAIRQPILDTARALSAKPMDAADLSAQGGDSPHDSPAAAARRGRTGQGLLGHPAQRTFPEQGTPIMSDPVLGLVSLLVAVVGVLTGFPMAFVFIFVALLFGFMAIGQQVFNLLTYQFFSLMTSVELAAIPLFLFMGYILDQSGLMDRMFRALQIMLGKYKGSLYIIVLATATLFAAASGIVVASVTVLGVMAAPMLIRSGYDTRLSAGVIAAGGTLGILIPPSVMLIVMGPLVGIPVSTLFAAAVIPGLMLSGVYLIYTVIRCQINPRLGPPIPYNGPPLSFLDKLRELFIGVIPITVVILSTLGLIVGGVTTPTDAAATGAFASLVLTAVYRRLSWKALGIAVIRTME